MYLYTGYLPWKISCSKVILSILDLEAQVNHWNQQPHWNKRNLDKTDDIQGYNVEIMTFFAPEKLQKTP